MYILNVTLKFENMSLYLSEFKKNGKKAQRQSVQEELKFAETAEHGSSLGRKRFGTKIGKLNKQLCFSTIGFGCWPLTASRTTKQRTL